MNYVIPLTILIIVVIIFQLFRVRKPKPLCEEEKQKIQDKQKKESEKWNVALENDSDRIWNEDVISLIPTLGLSKNVLDLFEGKCEDEVMKRFFSIKIMLTLIW